MTSTTSTQDISALLYPLPTAIGDLTRRLVSMVGVYPGISARVGRGSASIRFAHKRAGAICSVMPSANGVALCFENGKRLPHGQGVLHGNVGQARHLTLQPQSEIPLDTIGLLLAEAIALFP